MNYNSRLYRNITVRLAVFICVAILLLHSCGDKATAVRQQAASPKDVWADTSGIPKDTVSADAVKVTSTGIIMLGAKKFSGCVKAVYPNKNILSYTLAWNGMLHGTSRTYYESGALHEAHQYKENLSTGRYCGYWANGNMQFDCLYLNDKKVGYYNRWYETGKPYMFLNYVDDKEEGMQRGWSEAGKLFINYEARDGFKYGLQETALCYKLDSGKIVN